MKYRFYGDKLELIKYIITPYTQENPGEKKIITTCYAVTEEERDALLKMYPQSDVTEVDNTGYEWLDGTVWTQEQIAAGDVEKAIALGETAWKAMLDASDQRKINAMLMLEIAKLKAGAKNE